MKTLRPALALVLPLCLAFCACRPEWVVIRYGRWQGQTYVVQERNRNGMFRVSNSLEWRIRLGKLPPVPVTATSTDWGPPYTTDIYGTDAYGFITAQDTAYGKVSFEPGAIGVAHTMLYVSPRSLGEVQYETFYRFMQEAWPRISDSLAGTDLRSFPHIIGLVYGEQPKYVRAYKGLFEGKVHRLRIEPDGRVRFFDADAAGGETFPGIVTAVEMPGKVLRLASPPRPGDLSPEILHRFIDRDGQPVDAAFKVTY